MTGPSALGEDVSRETMERLGTYASLLAKWNPAINVVAPSTVGEFWTRHVADSLQIMEATPLEGHWADFGSGGGFPGLVLAIAGHGKPNFRLTLVESDRRKATFLRTVVRETGIFAEVRDERIEDTAPLAADVITARALAPLDRLLDFSQLHRAGHGISIFPKGATWRTEVAGAERNWRFRYDALPSKTNPESVILKIGEIARG